MSELEEHRRGLDFTFEQLVETSKVWPCSYWWWAWMDRKPWGREVEEARAQAGVGKR